MDDQTFLQKIIDMLSPSRAQQMDSCKEIGQYLFNIGPENIDIWAKFCGKYSIYTIEVCHQIWDNMEYNEYGIATLQIMAQLDNPNEYTKIKNERLSYLVKNNMDFSSKAMATLLAEKYQFKCANKDKGIWYQFKNHKWAKIDIGYGFYLSVIDELVLNYLQVEQAFYRTLDKSMNYGKEEYANKISKIILRIRTNLFCSQVLRHWAKIAYDPCFLKKLNKNKNIICFENGVYDTTKKIFRPGYPDDYCSTTTGHHFDGTL